LKITYENAPALGDLRALSEGDTVWLTANARQRKDWPRYADALAVAVTRGAEVRRRWDA
jgi:hypothetical protein